MTSRLPFSDDPFAATRMPLGDHLEELRRYLFRALVGFGAIVVLVFLLDFVGYATDTRIGIAKPIKDLITEPVDQQLERFYDRRVQTVLARLQRDVTLQKINRPTAFVREGFYLPQIRALLQGEPARLVNQFRRPCANPEEGAEGDAALLGDEDVVGLWVRQEEPLRDAALRQEAERQVGRRPTLATMSIAEGLMVYFKVALVSGLVLGSPWIFWQLWSFVAVGLYPHEKRPLYVYLPFSLGLFLAGITVCQVFVMPKAVETFLGFNAWLDLEPDLRLSEWLGFAVWMPVVFGLAFQTPVIMRLLERLGLVTADTFQRNRRWAWFILAIVAAIITPSVDAFGMLLLWVPTLLLYELGILLCRVSGQRTPGNLVDRIPLRPVENEEGFRVV